MDYIRNKPVSTDREAYVGGRKCYLSDGEEEIYYKNQWYTIHFDQDGDLYFFYKEKTMYFRAMAKETFAGSKR